jgi:glyoxylase-like metal-dependent hydrolase (beta-lactamase superfamily II)
MDSPPFGEPREVAPGIVLLRMPLPFLYDHINIYLFEEPGGWALMDSGVDDNVCRMIWTDVLGNFLGGKAPTRLVGSHFHSDHIGLAGWLHDRFAMPFYMTTQDYLLARLLQAGPDAASNAAEAAHFRRMGLTAGEIAEIPSRAQDYQRLMAPLPGSFRRLSAGQSFELGGRNWQVLTAGGHAPELLILWCAADGLLLPSDQVLPFLVPGVTVTAIEPDADPLGTYLASFDLLRDRIPDDVLVLPSHYAPFRGLHGRIRELELHHVERAALLARRCHESSGLTSVELTQTLFRRRLNPTRLSFLAEGTLAHLHYLTTTGQLQAMPDADGAIRFGAVARQAELAGATALAKRL